MKYLKESAVILGITLVGEFLNYILPFPVPAGVYGLFFMLLLFCIGVLKPEQVEASGNFLLEIMPVLFVPAAVGIMASYDQLKEVLVPMLAICGISTIVVMAVTGKTAEKMMNIQKNSRKEGKK